MVKGFLLVDGAKNVLLIHQDEMELVGDMLSRISRKRDERIGDMVKTHKTNAELDKTIHAYLKCKFNDECQEGADHEIN